MIGGLRLAVRRSRNRRGNAARIANIELCKKIGMLFGVPIFYFLRRQSKNAAIKSLRSAKKNGIIESEREDTAAYG
ncbi:MAG TPA: hypothetical protein DCE65_01855 [Clostridiales bacterium]|nr:hypothetical protein [Clostridiales bacterium]